jgi:hypothetical protein
MRGTWLLVSGVVFGCGNVSVTPDAAPDPVPDAAPDAAIDAPPPTFTVGGTVTGLAGTGLMLRLNGAEFPITGNGAFSFPGSLADGANYLVTIASQPSCPQRLCVLSNAAGTIAGANVSVPVTCSLPRIRLVSTNWGSPQGVRITEDILSLANNATATPRIVTGANTTLGNSQTDSAAFDRARNAIYVPAETTLPDVAILVFANAATTTGNIAPARRIVVTGETRFYGIELDEAADRLYASGESGKLYIFDNASTLAGTVIPTAAITLTSPGPIDLDRKTDRLYVAARTTSIYVLDGARQLTSASTPSRTVTWTNPTDFARSVAIDACRNRLYVGIRNVTATVNVFVFDNASTLTGAIDLATASQAQLTVPGSQVMSSALDGLGNLYFWKDSATLVNIVNAPHTFTGAVTVTPDKVINAVVDRGYGLDVMAYP